MESQQKESYDDVEPSHSNDNSEDNHENEEESSLVTE